MIYPPFLNKGDLIGVTAPSASVHDEAEFDLSLQNIRAAGYRVTETAGVRGYGDFGAPAARRAAELNALLHNPEVRMVWCATGGDLLAEMLPLADLDMQDPKWIQGYSDPTSLLYAVTTTRDIATIYGTNAGGFDTPALQQWQQYSLDLLGGRVTPQHSFNTYERKWDAEPTPQAVFWETPHGEVNVQGRLLGGCLECLLNIVGTRFDGTAAFMDRYGKDGILWYFDVFAMKAEEVYLALWHLREAGWFRHAAGVIIGRVGFPSTMLGMSYLEATLRALPDLPLALEADVGHIPPRMTLINGALATLKAADGRAALEMKLI